MNFSKPILVDWQKSTGAQFIRRHRWFFAFGPGTLFSAFFMLLVYVPSAALLLLVRENFWLSLIAFLATLAYAFITFIYIEAALER
jgi:hypothetical protein